MTTMHLLRSTSLILAALATVGAAETWTAQTVGTHPAGSVTNSGGTITVTTNNGFVWANGDSFTMAAMTGTGNVSLTAKVLSLTRNDTFSKAGVMIRESLAGGAPNVMLYVSPTSIINQFRASSGANTSQNTVGNRRTAPYWIRLARTGNTFTSSFSPDGTAWTVSNTVRTVTMTPAVYLGLVYSPNKNPATGSASFSNVTVTGTSTPPNNLAPVVTLAATATVTAASSQLAATVTDDAGTPTISWSVVAAGTTAPVKFSSTSMANPTVTYPRNGTYNLRITATDAGGLSTDKTIAVTVNAASPFTIQGTVADNAVAPNPGVVTTLKWLVPTTATVLGTVTTSSTGAFSHAGLIGSPADFQVEVAGSL
jgi:hypothetical protein